MAASHVSVMELSHVRREGYADGYAGRSALNCPYADGQLRNAYLQAHTVGKKQRNLDMHGGKHPDADGRVSA